MTLVLVTGSEGRVTAVTAALSEAGCRCVSAIDVASMKAVLAGLVDERVDAYVQLPVEISATADTAIGRIRELLTEGLVARFDAAEVAVTAVGDGGAIFLVAGNTPGERELTDDQRARYALLRVLSHTILADCAGRDVRSVVLPSNTTPADVASVVLGQSSAREQAIADFVDLESDLSYSDWRVELLSLATNES